MQEETSTGANAAHLVPGRSCDSCTMCCKVFDIPSLPKPAGVWCEHCATGQGCTIYERRPQECRDFFCHYRLDADLPEHWKPSRSHMVMKCDPTGFRITIHVDRKTPQRWREAPYYADIKAWAANRLLAGKVVHVRIGPRVIVVLPDREVDLGNVGDRAIVTRRLQTPQGPSFAFEVVEKDDPRAQQAQQQHAAPAVVARRP